MCNLLKALQGLADHLGWDGVGLACLVHEMEEKCI